ncbi:helix-turn-helix transcriptional regulator [Methyloceanibacter stevinii]|uniref:helix-turn-helix transcriptional regulator n=1 Tax=Methyloceanibacter stevinii TaxID=1774970 RepID=UPI0013013B85|nr:LuxR C-terminal-related transcriptional regulator [Methyloceanibacter stevinii]
MDIAVVHFSNETLEAPTKSMHCRSVLLPVLARIVEYSRLSPLQEEMYRVSLAALDHMAIGICVVDPSGRVIIENEEARRIFALDDGLTRTNERLVIGPSSSAPDAFWAIFDDHGPSARGQTSLRCFRVARPSRGAPFLIEALPLATPRATSGDELTRAMIWIVDPESVPPVSRRATALLYGLTASEAEVCNLLIDGLTLSGIARARYVSVETVKSQVRAVYQKVGVGSRAALVRQVLATIPPVCLACQIDGPDDE